MRKTLNDRKLSASELFISGSLAGLVGSIVTTPVEHGKIRMQMQM